MKKLLIGVTALIVALGAPKLAKVEAQVETDRGTLIRGRVVCQTCYLNDKTNVGLAHEGVPEYDEGMPELCGKICSQQGRPLAILTSDGKLYTITGKLRERGDIYNHNGGLLGKNEPYPKVVVHFNHRVQLFGEVSEKNGQLEIAGNDVEWVSDTKDWRVGSTVETKYSEGGKVLKDGKPID